MRFPATPERSMANPFTSGVVAHLGVVFDELVNPARLMGRRPPMGNEGRSLGEPRNYDCRTTTPETLGVPQPPFLRLG
jgi:hypothetical protein